MEYHTCVVKNRFYFYKNNPMQKRLTKSKDKKLFGVCGGLGNYFDIDPTIVRVGFLAAFFLLGTGLLLYIVLAIVVPDEV